MNKIKDFIKKYKMVIAVTIIVLILGIILLVIMCTKKKESFKEKMDCKKCKSKECVKKCKHNSKKIERKSHKHHPKK